MNVVKLTQAPASYEMEFADIFWPQYPRKVARRAAMKAWMRERRNATLEEIMDGLARYKANKPQYADWCHAATWLNQGRWEDEYETNDYGKYDAP